MSTKNQTVNPRSYSPEVIKACHDLLELGLNTPSHVADVFVAWSPHCSLISVDVSLGGWKHGDARTRPSFSANLEHPSTSELLIHLKDIKTAVETLLAEYKAESPEEKKARELSEINTRIEALRLQAAALESPE